MARKMELYIPEPCHEDWSQMTSVEKGKFCGQCQKQVYDFSTLSDAELIRFFEKRSAPICGRLHQDQLQRTMVKNKKAPSWANLFFRMTLPAFLLSLKAGAQKEREKVKTEIAPAPILPCNLMHREEKVQNEKTIKGRVMDEKGKPLPYVAVFIKGSHRQTITDTAGSFTLHYASDQPITLLASAVGFQSVETVVQNPSVEIVMALTQRMLAGEVVIVGYINSKPAKRIPLLTQLRDTVFQRFSVYPNPVKGGGVITLKSRQLEKGKYTASLYTASGQAVLVKEVTFLAKEKIIKLALPGTSPGLYTLHLTNGSAGYTKKIKIE